LDIRKKQQAIIDALEDVKGKDIVAYDVRHLTAEFDRVIIATGDSNRQVKSLARSVHDRLRELGERVHGMEGEQQGEWVLVDAGDILVHVMHPTIRQYYNLEELWGQKPVVEAPLGAAVSAPKKKAAKTAAKKAPAKKAPARKSPAKKAPARKSAASKSPARKSAARKAPARKTARPRTAG
jgi:ribosome-associated protein